MKRILTLLCIIMFISLACASDYTPQEQNTELQFSITSNNATSCNVSGYNYPLGYRELSQQMTKTSQTFNATILSGNFTELGSYCFNIICTDGSTIETGNVCVEVTLDGNKLDIQYVFTQIFILLFFLSLIGGFYILQRQIDFDRWYNSIVNKYQRKNMIKVIFSGMLLVFIKDSFMVYYILSYPIVAMVVNLVKTFNINYLVQFADVILVVYAIGLLIGGIRILGKLQEFIVMIVDQIKNINWGVNDK